MTEDVLVSGSDEHPRPWRLAGAAAGVAAVLVALPAWSHHVAVERSDATDRAYLRQLQPVGTATPNSYNYTLQVAFHADEPLHHNAVRIESMSLNGGWLGAPTAVVTDVTIGQEFPGVPMNKVPPFALSREQQVMELTFNTTPSCPTARQSPPGDLLLTVALPSGRRAHVKVPLRTPSGAAADWRSELRRAICTGHHPRRSEPPAIQKTRSDSMAPAVG